MKTYTIDDIETDAFWDSLTPEHMACFDRAYRRILSRYRASMAESASASTDTAMPEQESEKHEEPEKPDTGDRETTRSG